MRLEDKVMIVTGGNTGIGRGIVHVAAQEGARIMIAARNREQGEATVELVQEAGGEAIFHAVDLRQEQEVVAMIARAVSYFGRLDVVVNNAGAGAKRSGVQSGDSPGVRWSKLVDANYLTAHLVSAHALQAISRSGGGAIVNISSTAAVHGNYGIYGAAKAAVEGMTRGLAVEAAPYGVRVNCVSPGWIQTEATHPKDETDSEAKYRRQTWEEQTSLMGRMGRPEEIAHAVVFLASAQASFITGAVLIVDGGLTIIDPTARSWLETMGPKLFSAGASPDGS